MNAALNDIVLHILVEKSGLIPYGPVISNQTTFIIVYYSGRYKQLTHICPPIECISSKTSPTREYKSRNKPYPTVT